MRDCSFMLKSFELFIVDSGRAELSCVRSRPGIRWWCLVHKVARRNPFLSLWLALDHNRRLSVLVFGTLTKFHLPRLRYLAAPFDVQKVYFMSSCYCYSCKFRLPKYFACNHNAASPHRHRQRTNTLSTQSKHLQILDSVHSRLSSRHRWMDRSVRSYSNSPYFDWSRQPCKYNYLQPLPWKSGAHNASTSEFPTFLISCWNYDETGNPKIKLKVEMKMLQNNKQSVVPFAIFEKHPVVATEYVYILIDNDWLEETSRDIHFG